MPDESSRRGFLSFVANACLAVAGAALVVPAIAYLVYPRGRRIVETPTGFIPVGRLESFPLDRFRRAEVVAEQRDAWMKTPAASIGGVWVRRTAQGVQVFSSTCPHLACDVEWRGTYFECPCHDSAYAPDGARLGGPARRGLDPLEHRVRDGVLEVKWVRFKSSVAERVPI